MAQESQLGTLWNPRGPLKTKKNIMEPSGTFHEILSEKVYNKLIHSFKEERPSPNQRNPPLTSGHPYPKLLLPYLLYLYPSPIPLFSITFPLISPLLFPSCPSELCGWVIDSYHNRSSVTSYLCEKFELRFVLTQCAWVLLVIASRSLWLLKVRISSWGYFRQRVL